MTTQAYLMTTLFILTMDVLLVLVMLWILRNNGAPVPVLATTGAGAGLWLGFLLWGIGGEHFFSDQMNAWAFYAVVLAGIGGVMTVVFTTPLAALLSKGGQEMLLLPQGLRAFFGAGFLVEGLLGLLPANFALVDGITHITAAVLALMTALLLSRHAVGAGSVWLTNLFGLLDLVVVATGIAFALLPEIGLHHNMMYALFFAAPIFVTLHVLALRLELREPTPMPIMAQTACVQL